MKKYICELLGTLVLVLFGCGTACITGTMYQISPFITPWAFGLALGVMVYAIGSVSGCHVNPAVSLAMLLDKRMSGKDFVCYLIAQFLGAFLGAALLFFIMTQSSIVSQYGIAQFGLGANGYGEQSTFGIDMTGALITEVILTFVFVLVVLSVTANKKMAGVAGIVIGLALTLVHYLGIPLTGTSVNPARSFGPALMTFIATQDSATLNQLWVFIVAPLIGGALAACVYILLISKKDLSVKESDAPKPEPKPEPRAEEALKPSPKPKPEPKPVEPKSAPKEEPKGKPAPKPEPKPKVENKGVENKPKEEPAPKPKKEVEAKKDDK